MPQPPNIGALLQQAQKMQEEMMAAQEKLKDERIEASAGGGMVKVVMSGDLELKSLAIAKKVKVPAEGDITKQPTLKRLAKLTGAAFDRAIMTEMLGKHTRDRALFQRTATRGTDPDIKA